MPSIRQRGKSFQIRVFAGIKDGKKQYETISYKPKSKGEKKINDEVQKFAFEFEQNVLAGKSSIYTKSTFSDVYENWAKPGSNSLTESQREQYKDTIDRIFVPEFGLRKIGTISVMELQNLVDELTDKGYAPKTVRRYITCGNAVFNFAYQMRLINENPMTRLRLPKVPSKAKGRKDQFLDLDQAKLFIEALDLEYNRPAGGRKKGKTKKVTIPTPQRLFFNLAICSGGRRGEIISLCWKDIKRTADTIMLTIDKSTAIVRGGQVIKEPKTEAGYRTIPLPPQAIKYFDEWKEECRQNLINAGSKWKGSPIEDFENNLIFVNEFGEQTSAYTMTHRFHDIIDWYNEQYGKKFEEGLTLHKLRHTVATMLDGYLTPEQIAAYLGHATAEVTRKVYTHASPYDPETVVKVMESSISGGNDESELIKEFAELVKENPQKAREVLDALKAK